MSSLWTTRLKDEAQTKTTLSKCFLGNLGFGTTHMVWNSIHPNLQDIKRGHIKARLLTGTYMFQSTRSRFNSTLVDPRCPLCRIESEDLQHFILRCPALAEARERYFPIIRSLVTSTVGSTLWFQHFQNKDNVVALVIDYQKLVDSGLLPGTEDLLFELESCTGILCYKLHLIRLKLHKRLS